MMVIDTTFKPVRPVPVRIKTATGSSAQVRGPEDALQCLAHSWPAKQGTEFESAWLSCMRMLKRQARCDDAREAFVTAALKANVLVL